MTDTRGLIDKHVGDLLEYSINKNIKAVTVTKVIRILLEIDDSLDDLIIDGDGLAKYFNKKL